MPRTIQLISVEDDPDDYELVLHQLRSGGFAPSACRVQTADELLHVLKQPGWDAVISDYHLPSFSATSALRLVQQSGQDIPFIVVTGTIGEERAVDLMRAGANDFVLKHQLSRLTTAVERALGDVQVRAERSRALGLLHATNQELATLVEAAPLAICVIDATGMVRSWNPAAARLFGWSAGEVLGRTAPSFDSEGLTDFVSMRSRAAGGRTYTAVDIPLRCKDGKMVEVSLSMAPLGGSGGCLLIAEDIGERRRLESMLLQSQKMEAIGMLAGGIAHDFNNLLSVILGFGERLMLSLPEEDRRRRSAAEICRAAERASGLTRQLLAFSRKQAVRTQVADIGEVVSRMEGMLRRLIGEDIALHVAIAPGPALVTCDPNQIEMAIMNMAVNARDAMPRGGTLTIATTLVDLPEQDPLVRGGLVAGRYLALTISDNGEGMDAATCERIFEPFFTTKELGRGTGLGLATTFGVVKQSGGHIGVASVPGAGTTFRIHLPLTHERASAVDLDDDAGRDGGATGNGETVLVVEDEEGLRSLIYEHLLGNGYAVITAESAEQALALQHNRSDQVQLLLTDVVLPGMDGFQLAERLAGMSPGLAVIYMSGYTDKVVLNHGLRGPGIEVLEKPFHPHVLLDRIRQALTRRSLGGRAVPTGNH